MDCINCNYKHDYKFCPNCGEKSNVPRITFNSIVNEGLYSMTNMDKGLFYNFKMLSAKPQEFISDYIKGKRRNILNPISFLILAVSIYIIIDAIVIVEWKAKDVTSEVYSLGYMAGKFVKHYFKYFWIFSIFWLSIPSFFIFRKYNFAENLAINSFIIGMATLVGLVVFLIYNIGLLFNPLVYMTISWLTYSLYRKKKRDLDVFILSIVSTVIFFLILFAIVVLIGFVLAGNK